MILLSYAIFFDVENTTIRIPTNPESIKIKSGQSIEEYDILKLGKISKPSTMDLIEYSFTAEFPSKLYSYVVTRNEFKHANFYLNLFETWRKEKKPIRFIASNGYKDISSLVFIESLGIEETAGEEGDYYVDFNLKEYVPYEVREVDIDNQTTEKITINKNNIQNKRTVNIPKPDETYYTIVPGDTLWKISKRFLGDGNQFTKIHKLNQPQISENPNLIYPGQKIRIT